MRKIGQAMRSWKVKITRYGQVVFSRDLVAQGSEEALDEAWRLFDPDRMIGFFDRSYSSSADRP